MGSAAQRMPLNHLALDPGSHRTVTIEKTALGRLPSPGYCTGRRLKHTSVKETFLHVHKFWLEGQPSGLAHVSYMYLEAYRGALGKQRPVDTFFLHSPAHLRPAH